MHCESIPRRPKLATRSLLGHSPGMVQIQPDGCRSRLTTLLIAKLFLQFIATIKEIDSGQLAINNLLICSPSVSIEKLGIMGNA